jgi:hypothetical protein
VSIFDGATQEEGIARVRKRIAGMSESQMLEWLEPALSGMMRHLDAYKKTGDIAHLADEENARLDEILEQIKDEEFQRLWDAPVYRFPDGVD